MTMIIMIVITCVRYGSRKKSQCTEFLPIRDNTNILGEVTNLKYPLASQGRSLIKQMFYYCQQQISFRVHVDP